MRTYIKQLLFLLSFLISIYSYGSGSGSFVNPPSGMPPCAVNPAPGQNACTATPICNVHGFCGTTSSSYTADYWSQLNSAFCGSIENNAFLSFTAESSSISFDCYVYNCTDAEAIQVMIFSAADCGSGAVQSLVCVDEMYANNNPYNVAASGLVPGQQYYIMIDGFAGDVCDYTFVANDGIALPVSIDVGPTVNLCVGETLVATAEGGDGNYTWDASPYLNTTSGATVTITPPGIGSYQFTVNSTGGVSGCPTTNLYTTTVNVTPCCTINTAITNVNCNATTYSATLEVTFDNPPASGNLIINGPSGPHETVPNPFGSSPYTTTINNIPIGTGGNFTSYFTGSTNCTHVLTYTPSQTATFDPISVCQGATPPALPTTSTNNIVGTWSPATINTTTSGTVNHTFTANGGCSSPVTLGVVINPNTTPTFTNPGPICNGATLTLPTTSTNNITGTWSPAVNNTATTNYTFTPTSTTGCPIPTSMNVVVNQFTTPTFTNPGPLCEGTSFTLPTSSTNGVTGTWSPAINNLATTTYTFTPSANECASSTTMTVVINPKQTPTFTNPGPVCEGTSFTLPSTSLEGVTGTWTPPINTSQTSSYSFSPDANLCYNSTSMSVVVNPLIQPIVTSPAPICNGDAISLPLTSDNGISGTWSPAVNNTQTTTYTFTPSIGMCAVNTTVTVVVNPINNVSISGTPQACAGVELPPFTFTGENGNAPYSFTYTIGNGSPQTVTSVGNSAVINISNYPGFDSNTEGCYDIIVTVNSADACPKTVQFNDFVCVHPSPIASFEPSPKVLSDESTETLTSSMLNYTSGGVNYTWNFGDGTYSNGTSPTHVFSTANGTSYVIELIATNEFGCVDTAYNTVTIDELLYYIPNSFTPDGDAYNNTFKPILTSGFDPYSYTLDVFNRWGEKVFTSHDVSIGWDGYYGGKMCQDGTYVWKISFKLSNLDDRKELKGHVNLIR